METGRCGTFRFIELSCFIVDLLYRNEEQMRAFCSTWQCLKSQKELDAFEKDAEKVGVESARHGKNQPQPIDSSIHSSEILRCSGSLKNLSDFALPLDATSFVG